MKIEALSKEFRLECLKIANDICKSRNKPYGAEEIEAEAINVLQLALPKTKVQIDYKEWDAEIIKKYLVERSKEHYELSKETWHKPRNSYPTVL